MELLPPFRSSSIAWAGYDLAHRVLHVRYADNDEEYEYEGVPRRKWEALMVADSKGQYINIHIKPFHRVRKE